MIWPLICFSFIVTDLNNSIIISNSMLITPEINNILIIALLTLILNELIITNNFSTLEYTQENLIKIVGILVLIAFLYAPPLNFLIMIEMTIYPLALVILNSSKDSDKNESLNFIFLINTLGSVPLIIFINYSSYSSTMTYSSILIEGSMIEIAALMLFIMNTPMFIFHVWLTNVHVSSSGNCSIILASIIINLGTLGVINFCKGVSQENIITYYLAIALIGSIYFSITILRFFDANSIVAISSVLHIALIIPMISLGSSLSILSSVIIITSHGLISYFLFYLVTVNYEQSENRSMLFTNCAESNNNIFAMIIIVIVFINLGIPPLINFYAESMFLFSLNISMTTVATLIFICSLILSIIFTIQINTNLLYGNTSTIENKDTNNFVLIFFLFFSLWVGAILWFI